jgi:PKD repeat protein
MKLPNDELNTRSDTEIHITRMAELGEERSAGRYLLGSMTVSTMGGTPSIALSPMVAGDFCAFGTFCAASEFQNTYVLGTDFYDADGLPYGGAINHEPDFAPVGTMTVVENRTADQALTATDEDLQPLSFSKVSGPDFATVSTLPSPGQGVLHTAPSGSEVGMFNVTVRVSDGVFWTDRIVPVTVKRELTIAPQADVTIVGGTFLTRYLGADNPLQAPLTFYLASGPAFVHVQSVDPLAPAHAGGSSVTLTPTAQDAGTWVVRVGVTNGTVRDEAAFNVVVLLAPPVVVAPDGSNRPPVAVVHGPSQGYMDRPASFNALSSFDPDGDMLSFAWTFGDGSPAVSGSRVEHRYQAEGDYRTDLTVRDKEFFRTSSWTLHVSSAIPALAFVATPVGTDRGPSQDLTVRVQAIGGAFDPGELTADLTSSFSLTSSAGLAISSIGLDADVDQDQNHDGTQDRGIRFASSDVARLLHDGVSQGVATVTLRGKLAAGGQFVASLSLKVSGRRGPLSVALAPNPLNPVGTLSFVTSRQGAVDVKIFDTAGRLAHHPIDDGTLPAGTHEVVVGRGRTGRDLPSGIYFYQIETPEGVARGRFAVVK